MNPLPPNVDELVSAYLDGEATPDEIAVVESNTELMSRVDELRAVSAGIAGPVSAPADLKESHIAAALDSFDELFASVAADEAGTPLAAAVAPAPAGHDPHQSHDQDHETSTSSVVSFEAARERRRPRRFNTGVIAAVAAAILLFVGLAALSVGRSNQSDDVATQASDSADAVAGTSDDTSDDAAASSAMLLPDETGDQDTGGISELEADRSAAPPAVAAEAPMAEPAEEAMDEEAMDSAEDAVADDAAANDGDTFAADADADSAVAGDAEDGPFADLLGTFADEAELRDELDQTTAEDLRDRLDTFEPGLFPGCQQDVPELAAIDAVTYIGQALVADRLLEVHLLRSDKAGISFLVVDPADACAIVSTIP